MKALTTIINYQHKADRINTILNTSQDTYANLVDKGIFDYTFRINNLMNVYSYFDVVYAFPLLITSFFGMNILFPLKDWKGFRAFGLIVTLIGVYVISVIIWIKRSSSRNEK
jgi:Mg2+ and Co2+ transporter CorA